MNDSFIFYRSFHEATKKLSPKDYKTIMMAIADYALDGIVPDLTGTPLMAFTLVRPQLDANVSRRENGKKGAAFGALGGRPKTRRGSEENPIGDEGKNPIGVMNENPIGVTTETPNVNVNVNDNYKEKDTPKGVSKEKVPKHKLGDYAHVLLTDDEKAKLIRDYGETETDEAIRFLDEYIEMKGYKAKSHYLALRKWVFDAVKEDRRKKGKSIEEMMEGEDW